MASIGASLALLFADIFTMFLEGSGVSFDDLVVKNTLPQAYRQKFIMAMAVTAVASSLIPLAFVAWRRTEIW